MGPHSLDRILLGKQSLGGQIAYDGYVLRDAKTRRFLSSTNRSADVITSPREGCSTPARLIPPFRDASCLARKNIARSAHLGLCCWAFQGHSPAGAQMTS